MAKTLVDVDEEALRRAGQLLGTATKKDTINGALHEVVVEHERLEAARREVARARSGYYASTDDDPTWR